MADNIIFPCRHCGRSLEVEPIGAGLIVKCPVCGKDVEIPKPSGLSSAPVPEAAVSDTMPIEKKSIGKTIAGRRPVLFSAAVALALTFSIIAVALLVITGIKYIRLAVPSSADVAYSDIMPSPVANTAIAWKELEKQLAPLIIKNISGKKAGGRRGGGDREAVFLSWVSGMDTCERKQFCHNLEAIVEEAERHSNDVWQVMNEYAKLKQAKLREVRLQETSRRKSARLKELGLATAGLFATAVLLSLFAGVLALLAVERNTRRTADN